MELEQSSSAASAGGFEFTPEFLRKLERLEWMTRRILRGQIRGEQRTRRLGRSIELYDYRAYQHGDDLRYVDWNLYSRLDQLFVKLFAAEEDLTLHLLVDASASMALGTPSKLDHCRHLAAALAYVGLNRFERVGITGFSDHVTARLAPLRGRRNLPRALDFLSALQASSRTQLAPSITEFCEGEQRRGLVVVLSDLLDAGDVLAGLRHLRQHRHDVTVLHILAEEDITAALSGDLLLVDSESGAELRLSMDEGLRDRALGHFTADLETLQRALSRAGIGYARASTAVPFEDVILRYMREGQLLR
ncbi:MAG: DUF58 domain-containing protein [Pseudomonadota bacterium]